MSFFLNTSWSAAGSITNAAGRMAITVILARRLGPELFGLLVFVQWLIDISFLVYSVGLTGVATRFFPQTAGTNADQFPGFSRWFFRVGSLAVLLTSCFATLSAIVFSDLGGASLAAVTFWAATYSIWALLGARAQGLFQFKRFTASSAILGGVAIVGLLLPPLGGDFVGAILVLATANLAAAAACAFDLFGGKRNLHKDQLVHAHAELIRRYATNAWLTSIAASLVWSRGEISLIQVHLEDSAVGFYSIGLTVSALVNQGLGLLTGALWPQIARTWDSGDRGELLKFSSLVTNLSMLIAGLSAGFLICFAPYIIALLFGDRFLPSSKLILILGLGALGLASGCTQLVLQAATNGKFGRDVTIAGGVALFGAAFVLLPSFGIEGAAIARSAVQIGVAVVTLAWPGKVLGHSARTRQDLRSFVLLVTLTGSLVAWLSVWPELHILGRMAAYGVYSCLVCLICVRILVPGMLSDLRKLSEGGKREPEILPQSEVDVSILFITYNRSDLLEITFKSIRERMKFGNQRVEFVVTDDASDEIHASSVRKLPFDKHVLWPVNCGLGANCNRGLAAASGQYILQIQDDCEFVGPESLLNTALDILRTDLEVGIIQLTNQTPDVPHEVRFLNDGTCYWVFENDYQPYKRDCGDRPYSDQPHLKRQKFCEDIGRYAEGMKMSDTENDFQLRVACQSKWRVAYLPQGQSFSHLGAARSFNPSGLRAKRLARLESFPAFGSFARHMRSLIKRVRDSIGTRGG